MLQRIAQSCFKFVVADTLKENILLNFEVKNEATRANMQVNRRTLKWGPFWNKVYVERCRDPTLFCPPDMIPSRSSHSVRPTWYNPCPCVDLVWCYSVMAIRQNPCPCGNGITIGWHCAYRKSTRWRSFSVMATWHNPCLCCNGVTTGWHCVFPLVSGQILLCYTTWLNPSPSDNGTTVSYNSVSM